MKCTANKKDYEMIYSSKKKRSFWGYRKGFWANVVEIAGLLLIVFLVRTYGFGLYQVPTGSMETSMLVGERFFADKFSYLFRSPERGEVISFNEPPQYYNYSKNGLMNLFQHYVWGPSNWTKRIIGKPGDEVRGAIENGKPVVYLNGKKLDEPYLNKYPLIKVWKEDPQIIRAKVDREVRGILAAGYDSSIIADVKAQILDRYTTPKSYDPNRPFEDQPFYDVNPNCVKFGESGQPELREPGTPLEPRHDVARGDGRYWSGSDEFQVTLGSDEYWLMGDNRLGSQDSRFFGPVKKNFIHGRIIIRIWSVDSDEAWWIWDLIKHPIDFWKRVRWSRFFQWVH